MLMNYVALKPGVPTRIHFTDWYFVVSDALDRESGKIKPLKRLVFWVDELEGEDVVRTLSVLSKKLMSALIPTLRNKEFLNYDFIITKLGDGYYTDWNVQTSKRPVEVPLEERKTAFNYEALIEKLWNTM